MATMISPRNEQLLNQAVSSGRFKDQEEALSEALRLLREQTTQTTNGCAESLILAPDKWIEEFDRVTASRKGGNPRMDDSRESIYGDRGQ